MTKKKDAIDKHVDAVIARHPHFAAELMRHLNWLGSLTDDEVKTEQKAAAKRFRRVPAAKE